MDRTRKKQAAIGIGILLILCAALLIYGQYQRSQQRAEYLHLGQLDAQHIVEQSKPSGELIVEALHFTIYESEIQLAAERNQMFYSETENLTEAALLYLTELKAVYQTAVSEGYEVSAEEIAALVAQDRENIRETFSARNFKAYLKGMGVTEDQYWTLLLTDEQYHQDVIVDRYLDHEQEILFERNHLDYGSDAAVKAWEERLYQLGQQAMRKEEARIVSEQETYKSIRLFDQLNAGSRDREQSSVGIF